MKMTWTWGLGLVLVIAGVVFCAAQHETSKEEKIRSLLKWTITEPVELKVFNRAAAECTENNRLPLPSRFGDTYDADFVRDSLVKLETAVFAKHFTEKEIDELLAVYQHETMQKLVRQMPDMMLEIGTGAVILGQGIGRQIMAKGKEKGK
jgi:hypothetical protein